MANEEHSTLVTVKAFAGHVVGGIVMFIIVGLAAVLLGKFVTFLEGLGAPRFMTWTLTALEYVIFVLDVAGVLFFSIGAVKSAFKDARK